MSFGKKKFLFSAAILLILSVLITVFIREKFKNEIKKNMYIGEIKSCRGWRLNRLPEVKRFLEEDSKKYNVTINYSGGDPRLILKDLNGTEVETINLSNYTRVEINDLLKRKGFKI